MKKNEMNDIEYIMVTNWEGHWDKLGKKWQNSTLFTMPMIKDGLANSQHPAEAKTLFIKLSKANEFEKCWIGISKNFRSDTYLGKLAVRFDVEHLLETDCAEEYSSFKNGWYLNKNRVAKNPLPEIKTNLNVFSPSFFSIMDTCNWEDYEKYCYHLLQLLGINTIHFHPRENNKGKADGIFIFHNSLTVVYDATLKEDFVNEKDQQINNYVNQLKSANITVNTDSYTVTPHKQVWIITRGRNVNLIRKQDHIHIKEIPHTKLIELYYERLNGAFTEEELMEKMKNLA
ncbi:MAG TPA: hypothetical protein VEC12_07835 [Bacteroidia bacterium]|nr:hypothetical protein [Bacteroidia bacterium]